MLFRVVSASLLSLLFAAPSASAECAWIARQYTEYLELPRYAQMMSPEWRIGPIEETRAACDKGVATTVQQALADPNPDRRGWTTRSDGTTLAPRIISRNTDSEIRTTYRCLPVGLDPRPKTSN